MIAYLFPGQGSHAIGMGHAAYEKSASARDIFAQADSILDFKLSDLCFNGPEGSLTDTVNQQPALFTTSIAVLKAMQEAGDSVYPAATFMAGHSLGELSALAAAGAISFEDGLKLVRTRAELMKAAGEKSPGGMVAVLGLKVSQVLEACEKATAETGKCVQLANDNCPGQIVVSGEPDAVVRAGEVMREMGALKVVPLSITIAAHSPLMASASEAFSAALDSVLVQTPSVPVIGNTTAAPLTTPEEIRTELNAQLTGSVRWTESMQYLVGQGLAEIFEVGSGDVLQKLMKRIDRKVARKQFG
ncbi:MAG: [acyl-carrier-protein] S-malonyltransferase [Cellvibrionaceae bacterium]|jgi:[acyl-carrier-protein] S-malonyltransferase